MVDVYAHKRRRVARMIKRWSTGTVTLTRSIPATPSAQTPWVPGTTLSVYTLDARVDGVNAEYINGTTILATDRMVIASPEALLAGEVVSIEPRSSDVLSIDGDEVVIKEVKAIPAAGLAALFHIVIAS